MAENNILLVEGTDDEHVVKHLCAHHHLESSFKIRNQEGIDSLLGSFPIHLRASDLHAIGVVVDANADIRARWDSLRNLLTESYTDVPVSPDDAGLVLASPGALLPRVGIWLMPDNSTSGNLEDFLRSLVPKEDPLMNHARQSIDNIPNGLRLFPEEDIKKALLHTWLAWQEKPGRPYGTAIRAGYLDAGVPEAAGFVDWLKKLFG